MNKLKISALEAYCKVYARKTADDFFSKQTVITGNQILTYSNMGQVNLFILHHLFAAWQEETTRMQSPYFDYQTIEVQEALKQFMNTVSRHIAVHRTHFEPLVNSAATSTLTLLLTPYHFIEDLLRKNHTGKVNLQQFKETGRYVQIHKPFFQALADKIESTHPVEIPVHEAIILLDEIYASFQDQLEPADSYINSFSQVLPVDKNELLVNKSPVAQPVAYKPFHVPEPVAVMPEKSIPAPEEVKLVPEKIIPLQEQPTLPLVNLQVDMDQFVKAAQTPAPVVKQTPSEPAQVEPVKKINPVPVNEKPVNLNEKFIKEQITLNDRLKQGPRGTLLDKHQKAKVEDIKSVISLNQRFLFINELFAGNSTAFNQALQEIEKCATYQSAMELIQNNYVTAYKWDPTNEEVQHFLEIIERKFY